MTGLSGHHAARHAVVVVNDKKDPVNATKFHAQVLELDCEYAIHSTAKVLTII